MIYHSARFSYTVFNNSERTCDKEFIIRRAATNRVLNVLRHWVSKHSQVFVARNTYSRARLSLCHFQSPAVAGLLHSYLVLILQQCMKP